MKILVSLHPEFGGTIEIDPLSWFLLPFWKSTKLYQYKTRVPVECITGSASENDDRKYIDAEDTHVWGHEKIHLTIAFLCFCLIIPVWRETRFYKYYEATQQPA